MIACRLCSKSTLRQPIVLLRSGIYCNTDPSTLFFQAWRCGTRAMDSSNCTSAWRVAQEVTAHGLQDKRCRKQMDCLGEVLRFQEMVPSQGYMVS
jgi:hypothetical protein